jgi:hypothetical protein
VGAAVSAGLASEAFAVDLAVIDPITTLVKMIPTGRTRLTSLTRATSPRSFYPLSLSRTGRVALVAVGPVSAFDTQTGRELARLPVLEAQDVAALSDDGSRLAVLRYRPDGAEVEVVSLTHAGERVRREVMGVTPVTAFSSTRHAVQFSPGGRWLLISDLRHVRVYDLADPTLPQVWAPIRIPNQLQDDPNSTFQPRVNWGVSPDDRLVWHFTVQGELRLVQTATGREEARLTPARRTVDGAEFTADNRRLLVRFRTDMGGPPMGGPPRTPVVRAGGKGRFLQVWDAVTWQELYSGTATVSSGLVVAPDAAVRSRLGIKP